MCTICIFPNKESLSLILLTVITIDNNKNFLSSKLEQITSYIGNCGSVKSQVVTKAEPRG